MNYCAILLRFLSLNAHYSKFLRNIHKRNFIFLHNHRKIFYMDNLYPELFVMLFILQFLIFIEMFSFLITSKTNFIPIILNLLSKLHYIKKSIVIFVHKLYYLILKLYSNTIFILNIFNLSKIVLYSFSTIEFLSIEHFKNISKLYSKLCIFSNVNLTKNRFICITRILSPP